VRRLLAIFLGVACVAPALARPFSIGLIGDMPYERPMAEYRRVLAEIDAADLAFVVHVGDIQASSQRADDERFRARLAEFQNCAHFFIYTPGDNEWTDTHTAKAGGFDPFERLARLREWFFADEFTLGKIKFALQRQSAVRGFELYRENALWVREGIVFLTVHTVGSNNNLGRNPAGDAEYAARNRANLAWLRHGFAEATRRGAPALMIFTQAQIFTNRPPEQLTGHQGFLAALEELVSAFPKPVAFVHGDSHYFRVDMPLESKTTKRRFFNFIRAEVFGDDDTHWLRCDVDPASREVFRFVPQIIAENR
jgi:hypothetical protein